MPIVGTTPRPAYIYDAETDTWVPVAGAVGPTGPTGPAGAVGPTGPAAQATINYWKKAAAGGETSLSGTDDNSVTLSYVVGQELVYINGVLQVRGSDYVATTGTSITSLSPALVAGDIVTIWSPNTFNVANAYTKAEIDALISSEQITLLAQVFG